LQGILGAFDPLIYKFLSSKLGRLPKKQAMSQIK
jgi:hypothetical protein